jgi:peptidoglycan/xylan/chitin deacetylase (PgdA/CDA1 family)
LPSETKLGVSAAVFEKQIAYLKDSGYIFMDSKLLSEWFAGGVDYSQKYVLLTFDDAWADNLFFASPILEKFSARAILAVCSSLVNRDSEQRRDASAFKIEDDRESLGKAVRGEDKSQFLSWEELLKMKNSGLWDIQSHGSTHLGSYTNLHKIRGFYPSEWHWTMDFALGEAPFPGAPRTEFRGILSSPITRLAPQLKEKLKNAKNNAEREKLCRNFKSPIITAESDEEFETRVKNDFISSRKELKEKLGIDAKCLVWPWGHFSEKSEKIAVDCGFEMIFTTERKMLSHNMSPLRIPRIAAPNSLEKLKSKLKRSFLHF